ncbi:MAG TPA: GNAT family N-acetyltransferase [Phnomibacter sp.]|nr:GNAT family N-acetyltransferase [Phnomibacter sp.]
MVIKIKDTAGFSGFINDNIDRSDYRYKYLINVLDLIYSQEIEVNENSFVDTEDDSWIIFVEIEGQLFIYGLNYSELLITRFIKAIDLNEYEGFEIMGTRDLVYQILQQSQIHNYKVIKDRCFYQLSDYTAVPQNKDFTFPIKNDLDELVLMFQSYYVEEYNGERNKSANILTPMITELIQNDEIYVYKNGDTILAFCSIINPDIGIVFTRHEHRNHGIGRRLLEYCSSLLFDKNEIAYLMTDMHNSASNKICKKIGYELIYEHTNLKL